MNQHEFSFASDSELKPDEKQVRQDKREALELADLESYNKFQYIKDKLIKIQSPRDSKMMDHDRWDHNIIRLSHIMEEVITAPENTYPHIIYPMIFEKALDFFVSTPSHFTEPKNKFIFLLLEMMQNKTVNQEAINMCKGMWGYYLDDGFQNYRKKTDNYLYNDKDNEITSSAHQITLEETISDNLRRVLQEFSKSSNYEKQISESPDTNLLLSLIDNSIEQHPDNVFLQEIKYFAQLYANDRSPIESLPHNFAIRQKYNGERENKDSKPTGIPMSPHDRWYDFNSDRLLSPQTLVEGTGSIYLARERYGQKKRGRKNNLEGIKLSTIILELYIDQMNRIRLSEEYRVSDKDTKRIIRGTESQKFILQLSDSNSKLRNFIKDKDVNAEEELNNVLKQMITEDSDVSDLKIFCVRSF